VSIAWIGAAWLWLPELAGLAGIIPAVGVAPMLMGRKALVESRAGHVEWSRTRRRRERRGLILGLTAGLVVFLLAVGTFLVVNDSGSDVASAIAPGLMAWLLALFAIGLGMVTSVPRMIAYAGVLVAGGFITAASDGDPGWSLLLSGIVIAAAGAWVFVTFLRSTIPSATP
jgi:hypothetical protein